MKVLSYLATIYPPVNHLLQTSDFRILPPDSSLKSSFGPALLKNMSPDVTKALTWLDFFNFDIISWLKIVKLWPI